MKEILVSVLGGSGYAGGELIRLLLAHPYVRINQVTSERFAGKFIHKIHPNLRKATTLKFSSRDELTACDMFFLCLPHGTSMKHMTEFRSLVPKIIDLSGDFRLSDANVYETWYGHPHENPELLKAFVYGLPELHREEMMHADMISSAGCNATATILALYPLYKKNLVEPDRTVVEVKVGSSEGGNKHTEASHHPERSSCIRSYKPSGHRHTAEMLQELSFGRDIQIHFSATSIDMVRGALATCHVFLKKDIEEKDVWKLYREYYGHEPFIRIVKEREGIYRYPEPKLIWGTNYCDIGFEKDPHSNRLVVISAIDNIMKGAAGQALQAFNLMYGFKETMALEFTGLHPV